MSVGLFGCRQKLEVNDAIFFAHAWPAGTAYGAISLCVKASSAPPEPRHRTLLDAHWKFVQADAPGAERQGFEGGHWRTLNLPHDWSIEGEFKQDAAAGGNGGYLPTGVGWYRKHLHMSAIPKGQNTGVEFDGVYMDSEVWLNGHSLGRHPYDYTSFHYNLTPYLKAGDNVLAVRVDNSVQPNSRWYSGSGIYRHVWLTTAGPVHVAQWGTYITTPTVTTASADVSVRTSIENTLAAVKNVVLHSAVCDASGREVAAVDTPVTLPSSSKTDVPQRVQVVSPRLWSLETPSLYTLHSSVVEAGKVSDILTFPFGIRSIEYDKDRGFLLNRKHVKINGVCLHESGKATATEKQGLLAAVVGGSGTHCRGGFHELSLA